MWHLLLYSRRWMDRGIMIILYIFDYLIKIQICRIVGQIERIKLEESFVTTYIGALFFHKRITQKWNIDSGLVITEFHELKKKIFFSLNWIDVTIIAKQGVKSFFGFFGILPLHTTCVCIYTNRNEVLRSYDFTTWWTCSLMSLLFDEHPHRWAHFPTVL